VSKTLVNLIGYREAEKASLLGSLFTSDVALSKGIVDKIVPKDVVVSESHKEMERWLKIPGIEF